jgi:heat shock protein HtpX
MNFGMYWFSDRAVLAMYKARTIGPAHAPELYRMVDRLRQQAGLPMPVVAIAASEQPNAFATGRNPEHGVIAVSGGLLNIMNEFELRGVLAHEMSHIKNRDILISSVAAAMAAAISSVASIAKWGLILGGLGGRNSDDDSGSLASSLFLIIAAPIIALLIQLWISRTREFEADATGAKIAGTPSGLANALLKLDSASRQIPMDASPATAHMFIVNPFSGRSLMKIFSTHPPVEERVERLRNMT